MLQRSSDRAPGILRLPAVARGLLRLPPAAGACGDLHHWPCRPCPTPRTDGGTVLPNLYVSRDAVRSLPGHALVSIQV